MTDGTVAKIGSADKLKGLEALQRKVGADRLACHWMLRRGTVVACRKQPAEQGRQSGHPDPLPLFPPSSGSRPGAAAVWWRGQGAAQDGRAHAVRLV